ncbi:MAG: hypothetical protein D3922_08450 [Candidatus Electrothrix sp. AR1]|nr:hypothetical protein [Candidatus Electrothrix sp. AR1]
MMKRNILLFGLVLLLSGYGISCSATEAPQWSVGAWWVIETQAYNAGGIKAGDDNIGWQGKQAWRFEVSDIEVINNEEYYAVFIRPADENPCPYVFKFWYRTTDLFVGRYEVLYPETTGGVLTEATKTVRRELVGETPAPFVIPYFPNLPANISPLFLGSDTDTAAAALSENASQVGVPVQHIQLLDNVAAMPSPDQRVNSTLTAETPTRLINIQQGAMVEKQYWNAQLPWSYYSESEGSSSVTRRSWLVDYGN